MSPKTTIAATALGLAALTAVNAAQAFNMGNMMNPSRWFNDNDRYDRYHDRYGPYGWGGPYGWSGPYGGYGPHGYGWGGPYGGYPSTIVVQPPGGGEAAAPAQRVPE